MIVALSCLPAAAHELDLQLHVAGPRSITGAVRYSDNNGSAGEFIRVSNLTDSTFSTFTLQTDDAGHFTFAGIPLHRYSVTALGQEGHNVSAEITLAAPREAGSSWPPLYLLVGGVLLLSLVPAHYLRTRS